MSDQLHEVARTKLSEAVTALTDDAVPTKAIEMLAHVKASVEDLLGANETLAEDLRALDEQRVHITPAGYKTLHQRATGAARQRQADARKVARAAIENIREELERAALPEIDTSRESLDRDTALAVVGGSEAAELGSKLLRLAEDGDPAVLATLLNSTYGEAVLKSRGVHAQTIKDARRIAATSPKRARSPKEQAVYELLRSDPNVSNNPSAVGLLEQSLVTAETAMDIEAGAREKTLARMGHAGSIEP
jgi:hypothetical protein